MAFLKKAFYILFLITQITYSQVDIDTLSLLKEKIEYHIDLNKSDTVKRRTTNFYQNGLIKEIIHSDKLSNQISIFKHDVQPYEIEKSAILVYSKVGEVFTLRNYLNEKNIIDSTKIIYADNPNEIKTFVSKKEFDSIGQPIKIQTWEGTYRYKYDLNGKIQKIEFSSNHLNKTSHYIDGLLKKVETKNPFNQIDSIKYNNSNRPIRVDYKIEYITFKYDDKNRLIEKSTYRKIDDLLTEKVIYEFENDNLVREETFNRNKKIYESYFVYKNAK